MPVPASAEPREPWGAVLALGITQITAWGTIFYLFPLLLEPLQAALGASRLAVVGAFSGALLLSGLLAPVVGRSIDLHGGRLLMAAGSVLAAVGLTALARVNSLAQLYAVWALLGVAMACTLYEPAFAVLTRAFVRHHRRAIAVLTLFGGFASTVFWPLGQTLIDAYGWRSTAMAFGAINLLLCLPLHLLVLPRRPLPPAPTAGKAASVPLQAVLRDRRFYLLAAAFTANVLVFSATSVHMIAMLVAKGLTAAQAAGYGALFGPMQVAGRLAEMMLGQRVAPSRVGLAALAMLPASLILLVLSGIGAWGFIAFALLYGAGNGVMTIVRGTVPVELYGRDHYGAVNGALAAPVLLAKAAGPLVAALALLAVPDYDAVAMLLATIAGSALVFFGLALRRWN
jgi:MFS family permease